jgi:hypothetical protein
VAALRPRSGQFAAINVDMLSTHGPPQRPPYPFRCSCLHFPSHRRDRDPGLARSPSQDAAALCSVLGRVCNNTPQIFPGRRPGAVGLKEARQALSAAAATRHRPGPRSWSVVLPDNRIGYIPERRGACLSTALLAGLEHGALHDRHLAHSSVLIAPRQPSEQGSNIIEARY